MITFNGRQYPTIEEQEDAIAQSYKKLIDDHDWSNDAISPLNRALLFSEIFSLSQEIKQELYEILHRIFDCRLYK